MNLIEALRAAWGWTGLEPSQVIDENDFGNLLIEDRDGRYWRLTPEELSCEIVAQNVAELHALTHDPEFAEDWQMLRLVEQARAALGPLAEGRKYCLKIPAILGGEYGGSNLATIPLVELISFSGDVARQINELPDRAGVEFEITD